MAVALSLVAVVFAAGCGGEDGLDAAGGPIAMRRLTEAQYRQTIADVFGSDIKVVGRFEPDSRREGRLRQGFARHRVLGRPSALHRVHGTCS